MALLNFPSNPYTGQLYTLGNQTYQWSGSAWLRYNTGNTTVGSVTATNNITVGTGSQTVIITSTTVYINNSSALTTATLFNYLSSGTGITITTGSNGVVITSIASLQNVTDIGYTTTNAIKVLNTAPAISTSTGAFTVAGGAGIGGDLYVGGKIVAQELDILYTTVTQTQVTSPDVFTVTNTTTSISPTTGALVVSGGIGVGGDLNVSGAITATSFSGSVYANNTSTIQVGYATTAGYAVSFNTATLVSSAVTSTYASYAYGLIGVNIGSTATLQSVTDLGNSTTNAVVILNTSMSTSTQTGALVVTGGAGIGGDVRVGGDLYTTNLHIADAVLDSTLILVNTTATTVIDAYPISEFRSAKYLIQIDEGMGTTANFQVIEILLLVDNVGTVYATEYGVLTSNGELGEFAAGLDTDNRVKLYFTAYQETNKELVVLRTALAV
jgi:hypothetical protein